MNTQQTIEKGLEEFVDEYNYSETDPSADSYNEYLQDSITFLKSYTISILQAQIEELEGKKMIEEDPAELDIQWLADNKCYNKAITDQQTVLQAIIDEMV